jgi:hypothetical protein
VHAPVWLYHVFPHYLIKDTIFGKMLLNIKCKVQLFSCSERKPVTTNTCLCFYLRITEQRQVLVATGFRSEEFKNCTLYIYTPTGMFDIKKIEHKMCVLIFSATLSDTLLIIRRNERDIIIIAHTSPCTVPNILVRLLELEHQPGIFFLVTKRMHKNFSMTGLRTQVWTHDYSDSKDSNIRSQTSRAVR